VRIALFGSGSPQSVSALRRLVRAGHSPVAVVVPATPYARPLIEAAHAERVESLDFAPDLHMRLRAIAVDLICLASFPYILREPLLQFRAINLHPSLLPRHRGVDPIFWTYYHGDETTGATVHWLDAGCDSGDIIVQRSVSLPIAKPSRELYMQLCEIGSDLLCKTIVAIDRGSDHRLPQDESQATHDPKPRSETMRTDFGSWPVRRGWHYLAGLSDQRDDLIVDPTGHQFRHGRAKSWRETGSIAPGTIVQKRGRIQVHCRDGVVTLETPRPTRLRQLLRRFPTPWRPKI
jgi:methionyl-tRNA formyltransferase